MICTPHPILSGDKIEKKKMGGACSMHGGEERRIQGFGGETSGNSEDPGVDGRIILRRIFRKWDVVVWTGSMWLMIGTGSGHLWMR